MKPTKEQVINGLTYDPSEIEANEIYDAVCEAYEEGHQDGFIDGQDELPETNEEHIGVAYVVEQFDTVTSFEEFRTKYLEMVRLNLSYTPIIGPTLFTKAKN